MRTVFIGTVNLSEALLLKLLALDTDVVGVCTLETSSSNSDHCDLSSVATQYNLPWRYTPDINSSDNVDWIKGLSPDLICCFGWSTVLKKPLLRLPELGTLGFHPSALPANRGRHPIIWALALGLEQTGSTFYWIGEGIDDGNIVSQEVVNIATTDDAKSLYDKITILAVQQLASLVPLIKDGGYPGSKQDEQRATYWRKRNYNDGQIDWRMSAVSIHNLVRALTRPYPGAHFRFADVDYKVWSTSLVTDVPNAAEPGKVLDIGDSGLVIKCGLDGLYLSDISPSLNIKVGVYL